MGLRNNRIRGTPSKTANDWKFLHPFTAVKKLEKIASRVAPILQGERATELLHALQRLCLEGLVPLGHDVEEAITTKQFVAARHLASNSITNFLWIITKMIDTM
jgi:hypothetical protein